MIDPQTYAVFFVTAFILVVTPGPDTVLVLSRTLASGTKPGLWTLIGTQTGNMVHAMLAGLGISTIIMLFPIAFQIMKWAGAAYLVYLAVKTWRADPTITLSVDTLGEKSGPRGYYFQGLANNLVNAQMIPFFLALFPQFVKPEAGGIAMQSAIFGATIAILAVLWVGMLAIIMGYARSFVARSESFVRIMQKVAAVAFVGLAARLVVSER